MPSFEEEFRASGLSPIEYRGKTVHRVHKLSISKDTHVTIRRVSTNSEWQQAVVLDTKGIITVGKSRAKRGIILWEETAPAEVTVHVASKDSILWVYNAWEMHRALGYPSANSQLHGAAMIIEPIEDGFRYHCNDGHPDDNFDDIVFEIQIEGPYSVMPVHYPQD